MAPSPQATPPKALESQLSAERCDLIFSLLFPPHPLYLLPLATLHLPSLLKLDANVIFAFWKAALWFDLTL